jgi:two-component system, OmpR family, response regulator
MQILLIEDEPKVADFVRRGLRAEGWVIDLAASAEDGLELMRDTRYDVVLLDVLLPGMSGLELCRRLRAAKDWVPILMLSALSETEHRVDGLRVGADDYLPKPFPFDELIARIEALHRRAKAEEVPSTADQDLTVGPLTFCHGSMRLLLEGIEVDLSVKERAVLTVLMRNARRVIARERLLNTVWGLDADPLTNVVDVTISRIRRKLGEIGNAITTIRGYGYRLDL